MMVRCGACRSQFDVPGAGRFACPVCGSVNVVREATGAPSTVGGYPAAPGVGGAPPPPPPPPVNTPSPRVTCPTCGFTFIVGDIAVATCPDCGAEVRTGQEEE
jgi:DNA-directed RNA polymerase subunit RPC12/RpoP